MRNLMRATTTLPLTMLFLAGTLFASSPAERTMPGAARTAGHDFQSEATDLLREAHFVAAMLDYDAEVLETFTRSPQMSWKSHAEYLNQVRDHINRAGEILARLRQIQHVTAPWQQGAIDRAHPAALAAANQIESAILHVNENKGWLFHPEYTGNLASIAEHADDLKDTLRNFVELGERQEKLRNIELRLEQPAS